MEEFFFNLTKLYINLDENNQEDISKLCYLLNIKEEEAIKTIVFAKKYFYKYQNNKK